MAKRENILSNAKTSLENIKKSGGYYNNVHLVTREPTDWMKVQPDQVPGAWLLWTTDEREPRDVQGAHTLSTLTMRIRGIVYAKRNLETELNKFIDDVETALMTDPTRGGYAMYTNPSSIRTFQGPSMFHIIFDFDFQVRYQYTQGNP